MSRQQFALDYIDVASRIVEFRTKHPEGSLQQVSIDFREINVTWWCIYTAAAYRTPDDIRPGMGTAWEPIPGRTNFTRDSEVQNAETAAWGRAIVGAMAADTKRGIASAEEVRNGQERQAERDTEPPYRTVPGVAKAVAKLSVVTDVDELTRLTAIADDYYSADLWTAEHMETFNAAADEARARLT